MANFKDIKNATIVYKSFNQEADSSSKKNETSEKVKTEKQPIPKDKPKSDTWEKAKTVATILAFLTAVIGVVTKIMDIW